MKIAIDWDGTLAEHLHLSMLVDLHSPVILTAAAGELPPHERPAEVARRVRAKGIRFPVQCIESWEKGAWCRDHNVDIIIDDSDEVLADVAIKSPGTIRLKLLK